MKYAGKDATADYKPIHPGDALEKNLPKEKHLGPVDANAVEEIQQANANRNKTQDELRMEQAKLNKPPLRRILTLQDMEVCFLSCPFAAGSVTEHDKDVARDILSYKVNAYYASAADDQISE